MKSVKCLLVKRLQIQSCLTGPLYHPTDSPRDNIRERIFTSWEISAQHDCVLCLAGLIFISLK